MKKTQKTLVTNPILSNEFGARSQADLIDIRTNPDRVCNWDIFLPSLWSLSPLHDYINNK